MSRCLRSACARDYDACIALFQSSVDQLTAEHYDAEQRRAWAPPDPDRTLWHRRLATLQLCLLEDNGQLAGFIGYSWMDTSTCCIALGVSAQGVLPASFIWLQSSTCVAPG
ncbi:hypothetical protein ULF88_06060 [Halopseudomonas pachastrellae]|nr:hypothetical protein [Halopseudomonas pachastrellae]